MGKYIAAKSDELSSIPRPHVIKGEQWLLKADLHTQAMEHRHKKIRIEKNV